jgi:hypothetical protein
MNGNTPPRFLSATCRSVSGPFGTGRPPNGFVCGLSIGMPPMQNTPSASPAVASLDDEQARERAVRADLNQGLEDTFPASDPVSGTATTTAGRTADTAKNPNREFAPRVDQALATVSGRSSTQSSDFAREEIHAMRAEVKQMACLHSGAPFGIWSCDPRRDGHDGEAGR